jgi:hypothetical protein
MTESITELSKSEKPHGPTSNLRGSMRLQSNHVNPGQFGIVGSSIPAIF